MDKLDVVPGDFVLLELPFSEVCMSMQVAGKPMVVELLHGPDGICRSAQLHQLDGRMYSAPITTGEAGIYGYGTADNPFYAYGKHVIPITAKDGTRRFSLNGIAL